jgi:hypothetical protein
VLNEVVARKLGISFSASVKAKAGLSQTELAAPKRARSVLAPGGRVAPTSPERQAHKVGQR